MAKKHRKKRVPQLKFTRNQNIGWHVSYRDPSTGMPRRHRFGQVSREDAESAYYAWVAGHLQGENVVIKKKHGQRKLDEQLASAKPSKSDAKAKVVPGSLIHIASGFMSYEESRTREDDEPRRQGTITRKTCEYRKNHAEEFLKFLNSLHGQGAVGRMKLADLTMHDVEAYNKLLVQAGYAQSQVKKRMQVVKAIIDRANRPEHDKQLLTWNWDSRDVVHGRPAKATTIPTLRQLKLILRECDSRKTAMVWMAIGCGFGQRDLASVRVGQFDEESYDLRRGKTGIERYGDTPKLVWTVIQDYLAEFDRPKGSLMFITRNGNPLVEGINDSIRYWWQHLREKLGDECQDLGGFYSLRHLGATEFGSRTSCSIGEMKRWLGHSASSQVADVYMKPVSPEKRKVVEWVRRSLLSGKFNLKLK